MSISKEVVKNLALLAKLEFTDAELEEFVPQFEEIIRLADGVQGGADCACTGDMQGAIDYDDLRCDEVTESLPQEKITSNVEDVNGFFAVRRVVK